MEHHLFNYWQKSKRKIKIQQQILIIILYDNKRWYIHHWVLLEHYVIVGWWDFIIHCSSHLTHILFSVSWSLGLDARVWVLHSLWFFEFCIIHAEVWFLLAYLRVLVIIWFLACYFLPLPCVLYIYILLSSFDFFLLF